MKIYIVVDNNYKASAFKSKTQVAKYINVNKNTLRSIPYENNNYKVSLVEITPNKHKGRFR